MDQITSVDGAFLLTWQEIQTKMGYTFKGVIPKWFHLLEDNHILNPNTRRLTNPLTNPTTSNLHYKTISVNLRNLHHTNEIFMTWNEEINTTIYGKTLKHVPQINGLTTTYGVHWIPLIIT